MIVYHGSNVVVKIPRILQPNRALDPKASIVSVMNMNVLMCFIAWKL